MTDFRCALSSGLRGDVLPGTASTVRAFLLLEFPGAWGVNALHDARLPDGLGDELIRRSHAAGARVLLARRPGSRPSNGPVTVVAAHADPHRPSLRRGTLDDLGDVLDLDLAALRAGDDPGLPVVHERVLGVCTHGRHDACCAERGRPVAAALAAAHPDATWELSHIGGDRFAANLLALPEGLYYGHLDPVTALAVAGAHTSGHVDLDHLRGRSGFAMPVQYAEWALRRELEELRGDALRLVGRTVDGTDTRARFVVGGSAAYDVTVRTTPGDEPFRLTCRAVRDNPIPCHELLSVVRA